MGFDLDGLADLALFARVVDARSFSEAARRSGIAKSAVSRRIALLEGRLGVALIRRSTRALEVTSDGARLYEHCRALLVAAHDAEQSVRGASTAMRGPIRVSAPVTLGQMHVAAVVAEFQLANPEVDVRLEVDDRFVDIVAGGFDLVVRTASRMAEGSYVARCLATDRLVVVGAPAYFERHGRPERPEDLVHHRCLHYTLVDAAAEWRFRGGDGVPVALAASSFEANNGSVLRAAALAGLGVAVLPYFMVAREVATGAAELALEGARTAEIGIYAIVLTRRGLPARVRALVDHMRKHFARADWRERAAWA